MSAAEARAWLRYAREDLEMAELAQDSGRPARQVRFNAQQAAEKALKAAIIASGGSLERTHSLVALAERLPRSWHASQVDADLADLSRAAVEERYPDVGDSLSAAKAESGLDVARAVVAAVEADLQREGIG